MAVARWTLRDWNQGAIWQCLFLIIWRDSHLFRPIVSKCGFPFPEGVSGVETVDFWFRLFLFVFFGFKDHVTRKKFLERPLGKFSAMHSLRPGGEGFRVQCFGKPCQSCKSDFLQICTRISEVYILKPIQIYFWGVLENGLCQHTYIH